MGIQWTREAWWVNGVDMMQFWDDERHICLICQRVFLHPDSPTCFYDGGRLIWYPYWIVGIQPWLAASRRKEQTRMDFLLLIGLGVGIIVGIWLLMKSLGSLGQQVQGTPPPRTNNGGSRKTRRQTAINEEGNIAFYGSRGKARVSVDGLNPDHELRRIPPTERAGEFRNAVVINRKTGKPVRYETVDWGAVGDPPKQGWGG